MGEREAFEWWAIDKGIPIERDDAVRGDWLGYKFAAAQDRWEAWQEAWAYLPSLLISSRTVARAIDVHMQHASGNVGEFGSDADIRFFALALAGEAGELANVVKKAWRDGKPLNREAALEELAGTACYLVGMAAALECDLDAEMNKQMTAFEARPKERTL